MAGPRDNVADGGEWGGEVKRETYGVHKKGGVFIV